MHLAPLIQDLAVILGVAAVVIYVFKVIKQPVVLGYVAAGIIVGPYTPPIFSVIDTESVKVWSELGVIFLMFSLGLEFSFRKLSKLGTPAGFTGIFQIALMVPAGYFLAKVFGWSRLDAIFLGCMIAISSTTIIIKALEELQLKGRKFAELAFGILIVEDLAAILLLVALTNFVTKVDVSITSLLLSTGKLLLVVSSWIIFGIFIVPRLVKGVAKRGTDEMLTITSLGLCLGLVTLAAQFEYSVALGAFVMGSILAETGVVKRIETLMGPLRDVFGAVFFVSVGMLLDPSIIVRNWEHVLMVSAVIIVGKVVAVALGAIITGQSLHTAINTGFSMAQIGEFSFIIAALGESLGVINNELYPVIVAASLITTFTTPYLIRFSLPFSDQVEAKLPEKVRHLLTWYQEWFQARGTTTVERRRTNRQLLRFAINAAVVAVLFALAGRHLPLWLGNFIKQGDAVRFLAWALTIIVVSPLLWAMLTTFKDGKGFGLVFLQGRRLQFDIRRAISWLATLVFITVLSAEFFSGWISLSIFISSFLCLAIVFRRRVGMFSERLEKHFLAGFAQKESGRDLTDAAQKLVPWDAHLTSITVPIESSVVGKTMQELKLRERYGINVIAINRDHWQIVAPGAQERVYPRDVLLCFASDTEIEGFRRDLLKSLVVNDAQTERGFVLRKILVPAKASIAEKSIKESGIYENYQCLVVGIERRAERTKSPKSSHVIQEHDTLWLIGTSYNLQALVDRLMS